MAAIGGHQRGYEGRTDTWVTPKALLDQLGPFDLDPCAADPMPWPTATVMVTETENGLTRPWVGRVWLNPPYGPRTGLWLKRLAEHANGMALIFARTETEMFFRYVWALAHAVLFLRGRLHFCRPDGQRARHNAGGPSVLVAYGRANAETLRTAPVPGCYLPLHPMGGAMG